MQLCEFRRENTTACCACQRGLEGKCGLWLDGSSDYSSILSTVTLRRGRCHGAIIITLVARDLEGWTIGHFVHRYRRKMTKIWPQSFRAVAGLLLHVAAPASAQPRRESRRGHRTRYHSIFSKGTRQGQEICEHPCCQPPSTLRSTVCLLVTRVSPSPSRVQPGQAPRVLPKKSRTGVFARGGSRWPSMHMGLEVGMG